MVAAATQTIASPWHPVVSGMGWHSRVALPFIGQRVQQIGHLSMAQCGASAASTVISPLFRFTNTGEIPIAMCNHEPGTFNDEDPGGYSSIQEPNATKCNR